MFKVFVIAVPIATALAGCVNEPSQVVADVSAPLAQGGSQMVFVRADGKRLSDHPALQAQLDLDKTICRGDAEKFGMASGDTIETEKRNFAVSLINAGIKESKIETVMRGCMARRGYMYMTVAEATARADDLAATPKKQKKKRA